MSGNKTPPPSYADILDAARPEPVPAHPRMPVRSRAAQFAPFAALTGHDDAIRETARLTDARIELDEGEQAVLDSKLQLLRRHLPEQPAVRITYFQPDARKAGGAYLTAAPDARKAGGAYLTAAGTAKKLDAHAGLLLLQDGTRVPVAEIVQIDGALFRDWEQPLPPD